MAKYPGGVTVSGYVAPSDTADIYATHKAQFGYGGYRSAIDLTARDAITDLRREEGMVVYVISEKKEYRLVGGIANTNWVEVVSSGTSTSTSTKQNYLIFNDLTERNTYTTTSSDVAIGQLCYVIGTDKEYRLIGGTVDANWLEVATSNNSTYFIVVDIAERDSISSTIRKIGQIAYIQSTGIEYRLVGGIDNTNWVKIDNTGAGTGTTISQNYDIVTSMSDLAAYPTANRKLGLTIYVIENDTEYRLVGGLANSNFKETAASIPAGSNVTNNNTVNYYNTFGCLNLSNISQIINGSTGLDPDYKDSSGSTIPSTTDSNTFTFNINKSEYWINDWIYFYGTANIVSGKICEVYIELTQNGNTDLINVTKALSDGTGLTAYPNVEIYGTINSWRGYFKKNTFGRIDIKAYETQDGSKLFNVNKSVYLFQPNFGIKDGTFTTTQDVISNGVLFDDKKYSFVLAQNSKLTVVLARVQVTTKGIDIQNYTAITSTMATLTTDGDYIIPADVFKNSMVDGTYALVITGVDAGINIPTYFFGPFTYKKYG